MHGFPVWLGWLIEYWAMALFFAFVFVIYLLGFVVFLIRGWTFKVAVSWPLFLMFWSGPQ